MFLVVIKEDLPTVYFSGFVEETMKEILRQLFEEFEEFLQVDMVVFYNNAI